MVTKICPNCKEQKSLDSFAVNNSKNDKKQTYCRACKKLMDALYYAGNKDAQNARNKKNRNKLRDEINNLKHQLGCMFCHEDDCCCLDFHHRYDKINDIATLLQNCNRNVVLEEIKKCDVVCSNCHRKLHAGRKLIMGHLAG